MLTFFRRFRKGLLDMGLARRYMLYAVGEIGLVVIGILIALQINNWNENRIKNKTVRDHLESLAVAIEHDIRELSISMEFSEFQFHSWQYLLQISGITIDSLQNMSRPDTFIVHVWDKPLPNEIDKDFIEVSMQQFNFAFTGMVFNYSAINEINNQGIFSDIKNDSLKMIINEYYYYLNWRYGEQAINRNFKLAEDLKNYFRDEHAISCNYPPDPQRIFEVIRKDEKVVIMMKDLILRANRHYWATRDLRELGRKLVEMI